MLELSQKRPMMDPRRNAAQQPRKLLLALALLLVALVALLIKDRDFWFGAEQATIQSDMPEDQAGPAAANPAANAARPLPVNAGRKPAAKAASQPKPAEAPVSVNRTVLPPLDVEVVAGSTHRALRPRGNATKLEIVTSEPATSKAPEAEIEGATNAAERERMSTEAPQPSYPLLAQHTNVQGSVVLQALIGVDGIIENLRVLSGPAILATAAQQAVREWRFRPIKQNGQAVESKATITVNFMIKIGGDGSKTTLAESKVAPTEILLR